LQDNFVNVHLQVIYIGKFKAIAVSKNASMRDLLWLLGHHDNRQKQSQCFSPPKVTVTKQVKPL
jgi:hypothetical protein